MSGDAYKKWAIVIATVAIHGLTLGDQLVSGIYVADISASTNRSRVDTVFGFGISYSMFFVAPFLLWLMEARKWVFSGCMSDGNEGYKKEDSEEKESSLGRTASVRSSVTIGSRTRPSAYVARLEKYSSYSSFPWIVALALWVAGRSSELFVYKNYDQFFGIQAGLTALGGGMLFWLSAATFLPYLTSEGAESKDLFKSACTPNWNNPFYSQDIPLMIVRVSPAIFVTLYPLYADRTVLGAAPVNGTFWYENERPISVFGVFTVVMSSFIVYILSGRESGGRLQTTASTIRSVGLFGEKKDKPVTTFILNSLFFLGVASFAAAFYVPYAQFAIQVQTKFNLTNVDGSNLALIWLGAGSVFGPVISPMLTLFVYLLLNVNLEKGKGDRISKTTVDYLIGWVMLCFMMSILFLWAEVQSEVTYHGYAAAYGITSGSVAYYLVRHTVTIGSERANSETQTANDARLQRFIYAYGTAFLVGSLISAVITRYSTTETQIHTIKNIAGGFSAGAVGVFFVYLWANIGLTEKKWFLFC